MNWLNLRAPTSEEKTELDAYDNDGNSYEIKSCSLFIRRLDRKSQARFGRFELTNDYPSTPDFFIFVVYYKSRIIFVKKISYKDVAPMIDKRKAHITNIADKGEELDLPENAYTLE